MEVLSANGAPAGKTFVLQPTGNQSGAGDPEVISPSSRGARISQNDLQTMVFATRDSYGNADGLYGRRIHPRDSGNHRGYRGGICRAGGGIKRGCAKAEFAA